MRLKKDKCEKNNSLHHGFAGLIGNTPLIEIKSLSDATGCKILVRKQ
jgi:cysteine synthase A